MLLQGDTGQDETKIVINMVNREELDRDKRVRLPAAGVKFQDLGEMSDIDSLHQTRKRRRSR